MKTKTYIYKDVSKGKWLTGADIPQPDPEISISWRGSWAWVCPVVFKTQASSILEADKACKAAGLKPHDFACAV